MVLLVICKCQRASCWFLETGRFTNTLSHRRPAFCPGWKYSMSDMLIRIVWWGFWRDCTAFISTRTNIGLTMFWKSYPQGPPIPSLRSHYDTSEPFQYLRNIGRIITCLKENRRIINIRQPPWSHQRIPRTSQKCQNFFTSAKPEDTRGCIWWRR